MWLVGLTLHLPYWFHFLRWLLLIKLLVSCWNLLIFKVALRVESVKVEDLLMRIWEAAVWFLRDLLKNWVFDVSFILIGSFIWSSALLCCFELLIDWWRNRWIELYWDRIFLSVIEVFDCIEELFFAVFFIQCFNFYC